jgi:hypothetical protein
VLLDAQKEDPMSIVAWIVLKMAASVIGGWILSILDEPGIGRFKNHQAFWRVA